MKPYYEHAGQTIFHGDCREILPTLPKCDLLLTDPPYGYAYSSDYVCETTTADWVQKEIANDGDTSVRDEVLSIGWAAWAVFASWKRPLLMKPRGVLIWDKGVASGMGDFSFPWKPSWEMVWVGGDGWRGFRDEGVIKGHGVVTRESMGRLHPNEKPVTLIESIIFKHPSETIIDPFMGSGTTLVAAKNLGRKAIGIEIEEKYCEIAAKRLSQEVFAF